MWNTSESWKPLANYYEANVNADNYVKNKYYFINASGNFEL